MPFAGKVAIVTGANKGLGFAVVEGLCKKYEGTIYLTARNEKLGLEAIKKLSKNDLHAEFHVLDVCSRESVKAFANFIKETHGGFDVLVNNAAVFEWNEVFPTYEAAKRNIDTNYKSLLTVEEFMFPLLRKDARIVNISSACGHLSNLRNQKWIEMLKSNDLTVEQLNSFVNDYLDAPVLKITKSTFCIFELTTLSDRAYDFLWYRLTENLFKNTQVRLSQFGKVSKSRSLEFINN